MRHLLLICLVVLASAPATAQTAPTSWSYGTLILDQESASWFAPDGDVQGAAPEDLVAELQVLHGSVAVGTADLVAEILNLLGAYRWELVAVDGDRYLFKRPDEASIAVLPLLGR